MLLLVGALAPSAQARADPTDHFPFENLKTMSPKPGPADGRPVPVTAMINGQVSSDPWLIAVREGHIYARRRDADIWAQWAADTTSDMRIDEDRYVDLSRIAGLTAKLNDDGDTLLLTAAPDLLPRMHFGQIASSPRVSKAVPAQFLGYDLSAGTSNGQSQLSAYLDGGISGNWGVLGTTATAYRGSGGLVRLESYYRRDYPDTRVSLTLGDTVTRSLGWDSPIRFGGVSFGTNFSLAPYDTTYPIPILSGSAALPSTVELMAASAKQSFAVTPGSFAIDYLPSMSGSGDVTMSVRDAAGNVRQVTRSFYVSPQLLRKGLSDYSFEAGFIRKDFGVASEAYGPPFAGVLFRHGLTDSVTAQGRLEVSADVQTAGGGLGFVVTRLGEFSAFVAGSRSAVGTGTLFRAQFQRITPAYSISSSFQYSDPAFAQLGMSSNMHQRTKEVALSASANLGKSGSLNASYASSKQGGAGQFSTATVGYSANVGRGYLSFGVRRINVSGKQDTSAYASFTVRLGRRSSAGVSTDVDRTVASIDHAPPPDAGLGYHLLAGRLRQTNEAILASSAVMHTPGGDVIASADVQGAMTQLRAGVSGALVMAGGRLATTPRLDSAFALVSMGGDGTSEVYQENRPVGRQAGGGHSVIVTGLQPYSANRISVDVDDLPIDSVLKSPEHIVVPGYRQAARVSFGGPPAHPVALIAVDEAGAPLPSGLSVTTDGEETTLTGFDGEIFLANAHAGETLLVSGPKTACRLIVPPLPKHTAVPRLTSVPCIPSVKEAKR
ncbi:MAG: fimbrial biogenesis outer membrane usher protein [Sphingomonadales bacterium]|nr:fimbrial biogenesis outer membrane usher protein [Sphingomonadales bacterium]MDE2168131.1 fimbrial biogenesis outer membrane usher protein [Sphingomonadales bacterium]